MRNCRRDLQARRVDPTGQRGTSLLEVLVAVAIFTTALVSTAHLLAISTRANAASRFSTAAAILADQKMEQLRALTWGFDAAGLPQSDLRTDTAAFEPTPACGGVSAAAGTGLTPSPPGALEASVGGYVDHLDEHGCGLGGGPSPPPGTVYIRRWSIEPLPSHPDDALVLQVLVTRSLWRRDGTPLTVRLPGEARLATLKTRTR